MLDDYLNRAAGKRVLMKIDVEGLEQEVLRGGRALLAAARPTIVFESHKDALRPGLFDCIAGNGFAIAALRADHGAPLTREAYLASDETNFIARPV